MEKKKRKKIDVLQVIGILMILGGLSYIIYDFATDYLERQSIASERQNFLNAANNVDYSEMPEEAAAGDMWGLIEIDKLDVSHPVIISDDWSYLSRYVVAYPDSPEPGQTGNFSIAGHNGRCASCVFRDFDNLEIGDEVVLINKDLTSYVYKIYDIYTVHYTETSVLDQVDDKSILTLITCSEPSNYDEIRVIVKAELVETIPNSV